MRQITKKDLLNFDNGANPYSLRDIYGFSLDPQETVDFLNSLNVTKEEITQLNNYIMHEDDATFYDNAFECVSWDGSPCNFITGYRIHSGRNIESNLMNSFDKSVHSLTAECKAGKEVWNASLKRIQLYKDYTMMIVEGRGSSIKAYFGTNSDESWIAFPNEKKCTSLSEYSDTFWNIEALTATLEDEYKAITVAEILCKLNQTIPFI